MLVAAKPPRFHGSCRRTMPAPFCNGGNVPACHLYREQDTGAHGRWTMPNIDHTWPCTAHPTAAWALGGFSRCGQCCCAMGSLSLYP